MCIRDRKYIKEAVSKLLSTHNEHLVDPCREIQNADIIDDVNNGLESRKPDGESKVDTRNISLEEKLTCTNNIETTQDACSSQAAGNSQDSEKKYNDQSHDINTSSNQTEIKGGGDLMASTEAELQTNLSTNDNTEEKLKSNVSINQNADAESQSKILSTNQNTEVVLQDIKRYDLPEKWDDYPLDEKYAHPAVTLAMLTKEQAKILDALAGIPDNMKEHSFPCPMEAAMLLVYFSHYLSLKYRANSEVQRLCQKAIQQGEQFAVTKMQKKYFEKYSRFIF
ncbi:uncharacterized protein LOC117122182 [Anneissia japonica]|uniref:uncharacterized protein LOC117122182 n=1 Tax=Anneissia japonica TaxID=1529436 RepID=UPI0014257E06|nr:uncharacterized protein LOC117122182 [Anneissia japonica]